MQNEERVIELTGFLKENVFQNNRDLHQNIFKLENLTMGLEQFWREISLERLVDCNNHTELILREIRLNHDHAEKMRKEQMEITHEQQINKSNAFEELNNKTAQFILKEIESKNVEAFETVTEHVYSKLKEIVQKADFYRMYQNTSVSLRLLGEGLDALVALVSLTNDKQTESLIQAVNDPVLAIENSEKSVKQQALLFGNALVSIQTSLSKFHENHIKQGEISSNIKEEIREIIEKCSNRTNIDDVLQVLRDYGSNITSFQKQLEKSEDKLVILNKEHFGNISALINDTRKDEDGEDACKISALFNETYSKLIQKIDKYGVQNDKVQESMKMIEELTEALNGNIAISFERLIEEVQGLQRLEEVVTQIGDGVTETKRRVEYGVREISMDLGNLITSQTKDLSTSVNSRFDNLHLSCTGNNDGALANITTSLTDEFDHVWRQIGIMHQEMTLITETLNKLENNTKTYMNSTNSNIEQTRVKVSLMQNLMSEMDRNMNMLLRRIPADVKRAVLDSLNEIKGTQTTPIFSGPGPHIIRNQQNTPRLVGPGPRIFPNQQNSPKAVVAPAPQPNAPKPAGTGPYPINSK
ncbi:hypothetical protein FQR65_LT01721 [Abscondita terminalis]|nr:hypothetical protein FQR65_LT01721 [Abscondita terminalis]